MRMRQRRAQIRLAMDGNATMLIWLGKQYLGPADAPLPGSERLDEHLSQSVLIGGREIFF